MINLAATGSLRTISILWYRGERFWGVQTGAERWGFRGAEKGPNWPKQHDQWPAAATRVSSGQGGSRRRPPGTEEGPNWTKQHHERPPPPPQVSKSPVVDLPVLRKVSTRPNNMTSDPPRPQAVPRSAHVKGPNMAREGWIAYLKIYEITRAIWLVWQMA